MTATKKRAALVCEPAYMTRHVGVRSYIHSLRRVLSASAAVDLLSYHVGPGGVRHWYSMHPRREEVLLDNGSHSELCLEGPAESLAAAACGGHSSEHAGSPEDYYYMHIGTDLSVRNYDLGVITAPWVVDFEARLAFESLAGIIYDLCPNQFSLQSPDPGLMQFASRHTRGFRYFADVCDFSLGISEAVAVEFNRFFATRRAAAALPPLPPVSAFDAPTCAGRRERSVALAAPFDVRKGLREIPEALRACRNQVDVVEIYGGVRCGPEDVKRFFGSLGLPVRWWPKASASTVRDIYRRARVLLFPSHREGLGLPILEAQLNGCRVVVRDRAPMNGLIGPGCFAAGNDRELGDCVRAAMAEGFDHAALQRWARTRFDPVNVLQAIRDGGGPQWLTEVPPAADRTDATRDAFAAA